MPGDVQVVLGVDTSPVKPALDSVKGDFQGWVGSTNSVAAATQKLESQLKSFASEQRMQGRMARFYANEILEIIPAAEGAKGALQGLIGVGVEGLAGGFGFGLALEGLKAGVAIFRDLSEATKKAEEDLKAAGAAMEKLADKAADLKAARQGETDADKERRRLEGALAVAEQLKAARARFEGEGGGSVLNLGDSQEYDRIMEQVRAWEAKNGEIEKFISQQRRVVEELELERQARRSETTATLQDQASVLAARTDAQRLEAQYSVEVREAGAKFVAGQYDLLQLELAINNAYERRSDLMSKMRRETAIRLQESQGKDWPMEFDLPPGNPVDQANRIGLMYRQQEEERQRKVGDAAQQKLNEGFMEGWQKGELPDLAGNLDKAVEKGTSLAEAGAAVSAAFGTAGDAIGGMAGSMAATFGKLIQQAVQLAVALAGASGGPFGWLTAAGAAVSMIATIASIPEFRAAGGPVQAFRPYLVGERGPELIVPSQSGTVVPNHQLGGAVGGVTVNFNAPVDQAWWRANERHIVRTLREASRAGRA